MNQLVDPPSDFDGPPEVDVRALAGRTTPDEPKPPSRRRGLVVRVAVSVVVGVLAGGALWWQRTVTADPGLVFSVGPNAYRDPALSDMSGITHKENVLGDEVDVDFVPNGRLYVAFGLYNGGQHDVRIEAVPEAKMYYWAFDRMSVGHDPAGGFAGFDRRYQPFRPFTVHRGETVDVRLDFRLADCDPKMLQPGGSYVRSLPVHYRTFGITRTHDVPLENAAVSIQTIGQCTHPLTKSDRDPARP